MTPLDALAPDQRAVLELLLRQGRSYGDLSDLLAIPEPDVRERAHAALVRLTPEHAPPPGSVNGIADWLLGQQDDDAARRTSAALTPEGREWAAAVAERLREVGGERVPEVPAAEAAEPPAPAAPRPRPVRAADPATVPVAAATTGAPRSSRLGGAVLIGVLALLIGGALFLFLRGDDEGAAQNAAAEPAATPAAATPQVVSEVAMKGAGASKAQGLMRVFRREEDGRLVFALAAEQMPANSGREVYAVWFTKRGGGARNLGFSQTQVAKDGVFTTGGPQQGQETDFARWLVDYDTVVVARARSANAKRPGQVVLRGTLPGGQ